MLDVEWLELNSAPARTLFEGIVLRELWRNDQGARAIVVDFEPGSKWEGLDIHEPGPEEVFVVSGIFNDGVRDYPAGTFIHNPANSAHVPQSSTGCRLFVFYPAG